MPTLDELSTALVNADKAGDVQAATALATAIKQMQQPAAQPTVRQQFQASAPMRMVQGMRDPIDAAAQAIPWALGKATSLGGLAPNRLSDWLEGQAKEVGAGTVENAQQYEAARKATGQSGADLARLLGNVVSPANAAIASTMPLKAAGVLGTALQGAKIGAVGGALTPVDTQQGQENYGTELGAKAALGGATGAILTPVVSKLGEAIASRVSRWLTNPEVAGANASVKTDAILKSALSEVGQKIEDLPKIQYDKLHAQVREALASGKQLDAAALLRKADFEALGVPSTTGQITRDATQFARERNLRGVAGVGEPLMARLEGQNQQLQGQVGALATGASDKFTAGERLASSLQSTDEMMRGKVGAAYTAARESAGKDLEIPLQGLAQDASQVLKDFEDKVPSAVKNRLASFGVFGEKPTKVMTFEDTDKVLKLINDHVGADKATNLALGRLREAVKTAMTESGSEDVYSGARNLASQRFKMHDLVPAMDAVVNQGATAEQLVQRHVINGDTKSSRYLAELLQKTDPQAFNQARAQLGQKLQEAAFGSNAAGDQVFSPARFAKTLNDIGKPKLEAWFKPEEVAQMQRIARVGAYINSTPSAAPVNYSNTAGALASLLSRIPGVPASVSIGKAVVQPVLNQRALANAMASKVPQSAAALDPEAAKRLAYLLSMGTAGAGGMAAGAVH